MNKNIHQELEELSPLLRQLREQGDGLEVPPQYFDHFDDALKQRIAQRGIRRHALQQIQLKDKRRYWPGMLAVAASLTLVLGVVWYLQPENEPTELAELELSTEDITAYLIENATDFEPEQLAGLDGAAVENNRSEIRENHKKSIEMDDIPAGAVEEIIDEMTDAELAELL